jgi:ribulose-5-phosphate 4-epimerase/fuculose-1-phosphate aldolase
MSFCRRFARAVVTAIVTTGVIAGSGATAAAQTAASTAAQSVTPAAAPTESRSDILAAAIDDLVAASRILADQGVVDAYGHVSMRHPLNPNRFLMSRATAPARVTVADIVEFDLDSNPVDQRGRGLFVERFIHGEVYKARPEVNAVVHSHSPAVIPFGITGVPLRPVIHTAAFLWPGVPVWEIRDTAPVSDLLVRNAILAHSLVKTLGDKPVVLMRGHGNVVVGPKLQAAVLRAVYTEVNARTLSIALGLGSPITYISAEEGAFKDRQQSDEARTWDLWKERAMK